MPVSAPPLPLNTPGSEHLSGLSPPARKAPRLRRRPRAAGPAPSRGGSMSDKPSYLGLLNAVALAESSAHCYLREWAAVTDNPDVRQVLVKVAAREGEHAMSFAKRINELGYELREKPDEGLEKKLEIVRSS